MSGERQQPRARWWGFALLAAVVGPAVQLQQPTLWSGPIYGGLAAVALAGLFWTRRVRQAWRGFWVFSTVAVLALCLCALRAVGYAQGALDPALEGRDIDLVGVVAALPQRNEAGLKLRLVVESARVEGDLVKVPSNLYLGWYGGSGLGVGGVVELQRPSVDLRAGDRWQLRARLKAPHGSMNPHGFDFELWLWEQGFQATGYVRAGPKDPEPRYLGTTYEHPVERARQAVRDAIDVQVSDRKAAGLLAALVVGDQAAIDRADWDVFRVTGVAHLMAISGLHITMFAWLAAWLVGWLWRRSARLCLLWPAPTAALAGGFLLAASYALFSGWGVPAQRTVLMLAVVGLLRSAGRRWPWPLVWLAAAAVVVTVDPWSLLQAGFWLSFVAVGVLFAGGMPSRIDDQASGSWHQRAVARGVASAASLGREQWLVTLALAPLTLLLFGQVSLVGLLANFLAIPWVTLVVTPLAMCGVLWSELWSVAAWAIQALTWLLNELAAWPLAVWSAPTAPWWMSAVALLGGVLLPVRLPWTLRAMAVVLVLPMLLWQPPRPARGQFEVLAVDVGQGNAMVVRTADHTLVYDAGPRFSRDADAGHRVLVPLLRALGETVDTLVLSHRDIDHTGGAAAVLAMQPQARLLSSIEETHELQTQRRSTRCLAGQRWQWDGVDFEVLHPQEQDYETAPKPNALSCVLRVRAAGATALLTGDIEAAQEARLVRDLVIGSPGDSLRADWLLVPHHGSKTSSTDAFVDAVGPKLAVVQAGYRNRFGHPAVPVVERYRARGIELIDTPHCGAVHWSSLTPTTALCQRELARRYWHHRFP